MSEEDEEGSSEGDSSFVSVTSGEGAVEDDDEDLVRCWGAESTPEAEVSPADMMGPLSPSCSSVPSSFQLSLCLLLAVASFCPTGL